MNTILLSLQAKEKLWLAAIQEALKEERKIKLKELQEERRKWKQKQQ